MFSGLFGGGGSAKRAAQVAADKKAEARGIIKDQYDDTKVAYQPYIDAGTSALSDYQRLASGLEAPTAEMYDIAQQMDPIVQQIREGDYTKTPGYDFRMQEGQKALEQSAAAKGTLFSGATGKALTRYGQDYGTYEYDNYLNRLRNQLGDVTTQMGGRQTALNAQYQNLDAYGVPMNMGYNATNALAGYGADAATQRADYTSAIGDTYASGMQAKDAQMKASGDFWVNQVNKGSEMAASILTGGMYKPSGSQVNTAGVGVQQFGGGVNYGGGQTMPYGGTSQYNALGGMSSYQTPMYQTIGGASLQSPYLDRVSGKANIGGGESSFRGY